MKVRATAQVFILITSIGVAWSEAQTSLKPGNLVCEYKTNPLGIDVERPRLSWKISSQERGWVQSAYQLQVATSAGLDSEPLWDSGKVISDASIHRVYDGPALRSSERYTWRVRVWDKQDHASSWSDPAVWEMALLDASDWSAKWITPDRQEDTTRSQPAPMLRRTFTLDRTIRSARAYVTSLGLYEMELNGRRVGDELFTPGWTAYRKRLQYQTYDVTEHLQEGRNAIGVTLGDGWYRGFIGFVNQRNYYGDTLGLLAEIRITYDDGSVAVVSTADADQWKASTGPIRMSDIYMGEVYDQAFEKSGWSLPDYDDTGWEPVRLLDPPSMSLVAPAGPPVRRIQEIRPIAVLLTPDGQTVFDMGQNMVGWARLSVDTADVATGHVITLQHAEVLDRDGNLYTENLRSATAQVQYRLVGNRGPVELEPHFSFQGFRYVAVDGFPGEITLDTLTGVVIHSDMKSTGELELSDPMLNQLQKNIVWGQKGNFLDVPTDCPQRDERMGWTGDAQVFARTAAFNMDVAAFFTRWLADLAADQYENGAIPWVIPDVLRARESGAGATGWADAGVIIPWTLYLAYGDTRVLEAQYESMAAWIEFMKSRAGDDLVWTGDFHFGDWLAYSTNRSDYPGATTGTDAIATAFFAHSTSLVARMAQVLGRADEASEYERLTARIKEAFVTEFVTATGRVAENTQTAYALALMFDLLPEELRASAAKRLADDVRMRGHLTTGFLGTPYLNHVLTRYGYLDLAYDLLLRKDYPSWLYPITRGATTIWERWDGQKPDGTFQSPSMNSFNHYAYGAVGDWMYQVVAGIDTDPEEPGYKHVLIQPRPGGGLTHASASLDTMYGTVSSSWQRDGETLRLRVAIPANTRATIRIPFATTDRTTEGGRPLNQAAGITNVREENGAVVLATGSGVYHFETTRTQD